MERNNAQIKKYARINAAARPITANVAVELELIRRAKAGDVNARNKLLEAQLMSLISMGLKRNYRSYRGDVTEMADAVAVRFDEIIEKFDETRGIRFFTFMVNWARSEMGTELINDRAGVRVPANIFKEGRANDVAKCISGYRPMAEDTDVTLFDTIPDEHVDVFEEAVNMERRSMINHYMASLTDEEKFVINALFLEERTLASVADELGARKERVRHVRDVAIKKMGVIAKDEFNNTLDAFPNL